MTARKSPRETYRRLTAVEAHARGVSPKAKHYVRSNVKHVTRQTKTLTERSYRNQLTQYETGEKISREKLTQKRKSGQIQYKSATTEATAKLNSQLAKIRKMIHGVSPIDARIINDYKNNGGWIHLQELDDEDGGDRQVEFGKLFKRYDREEVLEALGSPIEKRDLSKSYKHRARAA